MSGGSCWKKIYADACREQLPVRVDSTGQAILLRIKAALYVYNNLKFKASKSGFLTKENAMFSSPIHDVQCNSEWAFSLHKTHLPFIFIVAQESAKLGSIGMFKKHDEKMIVELKRTRELTKNLPDTVQEEQEDRGFPFLLTI